MFAPKFKKELSEEKKASRKKIELMQIEAQKTKNEWDISKANKWILTFNENLVADGYQSSQGLAFITQTGDLTANVEHAYFRESMA